MRREYLCKIRVNNRSLKLVLIDSHYETKHSKSMDDQVILKLVRTLEGAEHKPENLLPSGFEIYVTEPIFLEEKPYRLIWTLHPNENYLGVIKALRRRHAKLSK